MERRYPKRSRLLEFFAAVAVIAIVAGVMLEGLSRIEEEAEKVVVESTVRNIDSGLRSAQAALIAQQRENERADLLRRNPVAWLEMPPDGYAGEAQGVDPAALTAGQWMWDSRARTLYYRPRRARALRVDGGVGWLGWRVAAPGGGQGERQVGLGMLRVEAARAYEWRP